MHSAEAAKRPEESRHEWAERIVGEVADRVIYEGIDYVAATSEGDPTGTVRDYTEGGDIDLVIIPLQEGVTLGDRKRSPAGKFLSGASASRCC